MKPLTLVISNGSGSKSKFPLMFAKVLAPYKPKYGESYPQGLVENKSIEDTPKSSEAEVTTVDKCTCKIEDGTWDLDEATVILNAGCTACNIVINEMTPSKIIEIEKEILPADDGFEEITLGNCPTCSGPARTCGCIDANLELPFDHELDDCGFCDESPTTVIPRKIRAIELEVDDIYDPMSDGCTDTLRRISYAGDPHERVEVHEVGYTFIDHKTN